MALKKVISFNHAKTWPDLTAMLGGKTKNIQTNSAGTALRFMGVAKGARWNTKSGNTLQRFSYNFATTFPGHSGNSSTYEMILDVGSAQEYYSAGGFCLTFQGRYDLTPKRMYYYTPDGVTIRGVPNWTQYRDSTDFYNWSAATSVPGGTGYGWDGDSTSHLKIIENGEVLMTTNAYMGKWNSATNPTVSVAQAATNVGYNDATYHDGYYYYTWFNRANNSGATIYRTNVFGGTPTVVWDTKNGQSSGGIPTTIDWFAQAGCFIYVGTDYNSKAILIGRSLNGTSWTAVFSGGTTAATPRATACSADGTKVVVVGDSGRIWSSTDGGVTWAIRTSGTTEYINWVTFYNGEFIALTNQSNTLISTDATTWTVVTNDLNLNGLNLVWRDLKMNDGLYMFALNSVISAVMKYAGQGTWELIQGTTTARFAPNASVTPTGLFFADAYSGSGFLTGGNQMMGINATNSGICTYLGAATGTQRDTVSNSVDTLWHKCQIVGRSVSGQSVPTFDVEFWVDDVKVGTTATNVAAASSTQRLWFCTSPCGFSMWGDVIMTDMSGTSMNDIPRGDIQVRPRPTGFDTDVGTPQWERVPTGAASNAAAASGDGRVLAATNFVQSSAVGNEDTYQNSGNAPPIAGYRLAAVNTTMVFNRLGIPTPAIELDVSHNAVDLGSRSLVLDGSTTDFIGLDIVAEKDGNGNPWTEASLKAMQVSIKRTA